MEYSINKIASIIDANILGNGDKNCSVKHLFIDSRNIFSPQNSVFFAIVGARNNGHLFIEDLHKKGFRNFVVNHDFQINEQLENANYLIVKNTLSALQKLSSEHRKNFKFPIIGITGSNGKTIVKEWLSQILSAKRIVKNPKSYNSQVGVPLSVWALHENAEIGIFEAGISQTGEMENLEKIISPQIGIFTNIGQAHQENFKTLEEKITEKLKLFTHSEVLIYCKDFTEIDNLVEKTQLKTFTWSQKEKANLEIKNISINNRNTDVSCVFENQKIEISIPFTDKASIENAINCLATLLYLKVKPEEFSENFKHLQAIEMRLEIKLGINNCTIINDTYNSDIGSLSIAIDLLKQQNQNTKKTIIISDILQSGIGQDELYFKIADIINHSAIDKLFLIGKSISQHSNLFKIDCEKFENTDEFLSKYNSKSFSNEAILLKGARIFEFEKISKLLQQKNHETVLEINLNAITHNLNYFKSQLSPNVKLMTMVKAFSYGSGISEIANLLQYQRVDYLAVAFADEGIELRNAGITLPIMVMNTEIHSFSELVKYNLEPEIFSFRILKNLTDFLKQSNISDFPIHLKIDTGMKRLGFLPNEMKQVIDEIKLCDKIKIKSIFTHLIATDDVTKDDFTKLQLKLFNQASTEICNSFDYKIIRHALNSSGIERFKDAQFEMVRLGIGLYGISAVHQQNLKNISSLKTTISQIKVAKKGETIGYGGNNAMETETTIATIPIGYADGLNRKLGNRNGNVLINNTLVPIVGNICMDMCMIDISTLNNVHEGDEVIIFNEKLSISDIAKTLGTIPYEILTGISGRVKRVYIQE